VSGCSSIERTGVVDISKNAKLLINLDHHPDNKRYGDINIVDPGISSVAELTYHLFNHNTWPINTKIATCLITGIITDTGSFLHSNTELSTLRAASELMRKGARTAHVAKHAFQGKDVIGLQAWGKAMQNTWVDNTKHMACSVVTAEDIEELGNPPLSVFEGVVETINKIPEAKFALFLKQDGELIKGSLRSDPHKQDGGVDVGSLAKLFGGGGHRFAAGFAFPGQLKRINGKTVILENQKNRKPEPILD
jgi:phosphoesterase RecJ-like protein